MLNDELLAQIETYLAANFMEPAPKPPKLPKRSERLDVVAVQHACLSVEHFAAKRKVVPKAKLAERLKQLKETFPQYLLNFIAERGLNEVDVYKRARLSRQIFSKLRTQKGYMPRKRTIIAIAFAMELTLDEAQDLLERGGYSLSPSIKEDVIISFFFENKIYDFFEINEALYHFGFKPLN